MPAQGVHSQKNFDRTVTSHAGISSRKGNDQLNMYDRRLLGQTGLAHQSLQSHPTMKMGIPGHEETHGYSRA